MEFRITTTGTLSPVVFNDIGGRTFVHPTTAYNLASEFSLDEISNSASVQSAITAGHITVTNELGQPIASVDGVAGEINTVSNIGTAGVGIYKQKTGVNFELKKIQVASTKLTISDNTGANQVDLDLGSHASTHNAGGTDAMAIDSAAATGSLRTIGTGALQACAGNDSRLSDDRTASGLRTASTVVSVSAAAAPSSGQVLTATGGTAATWQTPVAVASPSELNTGTDNAKYASALALEGSKYLDQDGSKLYAVATGTDTYAITVTPAPTAYAAGNAYVVKFTNGNTGAATLNVNALGAKSIVKGASSALVSGDIPAGRICLLVYDGTNFLADFMETTALHSNVSGEINALTSKATPVSADLLVIEDSAASNAKKKITLGGVTALGAPPWGYQSAVAEADTSTTSTTFQTKTTLVVTGFTGTGKITGVAEMSSSIVNHTFGVRVQNTTDATTVAENVQRTGAAVQVIGFYFEGDITFTGASKTFEIQFRRDPSDGGATPGIHIRRARLFFERLT